MTQLAPLPPPDQEVFALLAAVHAASEGAGGVQPCIVVRLTDGRVKILQSPGPDARHLANAIALRYGPLSAAYAVEPDPARVVDLLRRRCWRHGPTGWTFDEPSNQGRAAGLSRNAAIFAASLGMTTGALP